MSSRGRAGALRDLLRRGERVLDEGWAAAEFIPAGQKAGGRALLTTERFILVPGWEMRLNLLRPFGLRTLTSPEALELADIVRVETRPGPLRTDRLAIQLSDQRWLLLMFMDWRYGTAQPKRIPEWSDHIAVAQSALSGASAAGGRMDGPAGAEVDLPATPYVGRSYRWAWRFAIAVWIAVVAGIFVLLRLFG